jgi:hypothetical protein
VVNLPAEIAVRQKNAALESLPGSGYKAISGGGLYHQADQIVLYLAVAKGKPLVTVSRITDHLTQ